MHYHLNPCCWKFQHQRTAESNTLALPDPIPTLTVNSVTYDFARTGFGDTSSVYQTGDGLNRLTLSHAVKNRHRAVIRLDRTETVDDPFTTGSSYNSSFSVYTVFDWKDNDFAAEDLDYGGQLLEAVMLSGTPDYRLRFLKGEI